MTNDLFKKIKRQIEHGLQTTAGNSPYVVAIDGMSGGGKTTLGELLHQEFPCSNLFHIDDYFLQPHQRTSERLVEVGGNVDYERFKDEIILHLGDSDGLYYHTYDCHTQTLSSEIHVTPKPLVIIEGAYSQHPYFDDVYNLRIFCEISEDEQRKRIAKRNGTKMLERFFNDWIPKENLYFQTYHIKEKSAFVYNTHVQQKSSLT